MAAGLLRDARMCVRAMVDSVLMTTTNTTIPYTQQNSLQRQPQISPTTVRSLGGCHETRHANSLDKQQFCLQPLLVHAIDVCRKRRGGIYSFAYFLLGHDANVAESLWEPGAVLTRMTNNAHNSSTMAIDSGPQALL
mmetsp:Transcript_4593/g.8714  ORF Transcript_4593/g.8714 Transcript_4593/m.8714 type:complete len:137 (-) Transcript_4593:83-493(-)|eukprot:scaffold458_cov150-Amphora_coffeaeformis.AAC.7